MVVIALMKKRKKREGKGESTGTLGDIPP